MYEVHNNHCCFMNSKIGVNIRFKMLCFKRQMFVLVLIWHHVFQFESCDSFRDLPSDWCTSIYASW